MKVYHRKEAEEELKRNWVVIASLAWKGYQNMGRGYLLIDELPPERMRYMTFKDDAPSPSDASPALQKWATDIDGLLKKYNSKKEVIVAVWISNDAGKGGIYRTQLDFSAPSW